MGPLPRVLTVRTRLACDLCGQWRRLGVQKAAALPDSWTCAENPDRSYSRRGHGRGWSYCNHTVIILYSYCNHITGEGGHVWTMLTSEPTGRGGSGGSVVTLALACCLVLPASYSFTHPLPITLHTATHHHIHPPYTSTKPRRRTTSHRRSKCARAARQVRGHAGALRRADRQAARHARARAQTTEDQTCAAAPSCRHIVLRVPRASSPAKE